MSSKQATCTLVWITVYLVCMTVYWYFNVDVRNLDILHYFSDNTAATSAIKPQQRKRDLIDVVEVQSTGNFTDRVAAFNSVLSSLRAEELERQRTGSWQVVKTDQLNVVLGTTDDYVQLLSKYSNVSTVVLPWLINSSSPTAWSSLRDNSNLLIRSYFNGTSDDKLCVWITHNNETCNRNVNDTVTASSLKSSYLVGNRITRKFNWPTSGLFYQSHIYPIFYMHIHRNAIITARGDVISGNLVLVLPNCRFKHIKPSLSVVDNFNRTPLYNEVFVITQHWGTAYFHRMVEILPRVALYVDFLKSNPQIRILAPEAKGLLAELLQIIGLHKLRLVTGVIRARIVYQPRTTACGIANVPESQMLSQLYRNYITQTFSSQPRNKLVLIRRSKKRVFSKQKEIEKVMKHAARDYNLTYTLFIDNPAPSLKNTMMMFHSAVIIVAPHWLD